MAADALRKERRGYVRVLGVGGAHLFVHWSLPVALILIWGVASIDSDFDKGAFLCTGYLLLIVLHELSHAIVAWCVGVRVFAIYVSGAGGLCLIERAIQVWRSVLVYSAGLIAQTVLLAATLWYLARFGEPESLFGKCLVLSFTFLNGWIVLWNLFPHKVSDGIESDGYVLWKLYLHTFHGHPHPHPVPLAPDQAPVFSPETSLLSLPALVPADFRTGLEILNDHTTPMAFVVEMLTRHLKLDQLAAAEMMLRIHNNGGALVPVSSLQRAQEIAAAITSEANANGHALTCRAVTRQPDA